MTDRQTEEKTVRHPEQKLCLPKYEGRHNFWYIFMMQKNVVYIVYDTKDHG